MAVDGFRFEDLASRKVLQAWLRRESASAEIPWTPFRAPLSQARVALVSSAGISRIEDAPFDQEGERGNPWWGDPTHRVIPRETETGQVRIGHLHIDPRPALEDLDCVLPLRRLDELVEAGVVGASAPSHYSVMGYILKPQQLLEETVPRIAESMKREQVDLALLAPV